MDHVSVRAEHRSQQVPQAAGSLGKCHAGLQYFLALAGRGDGALLEHGWTLGC